VTQAQLLAPATSGTTIVNVTAPKLTGKHCNFVIFTQSNTYDHNFIILFGIWNDLKMDLL